MVFKRVSLPITFYLILFFSRHFIFLAFLFFVLQLIYQFQVSAIIHCCTTDASCSQFGHPAVKGHRVFTGSRGELCLLS